MKARDYIIDKLESFINTFLNTRVRYEHDERSISHTIEILPVDVYQKDKDYISWESKMYDEFVSLYPNENICFISDNALVGIDNAIFVKEGINYAPFSVEKKTISYGISNIRVSQKSVKNKLSFTYNELESELIPVKGTNIPVEYTDYSYLTAA